MKSLRKRSLSILLSAVVVLASLAMFIPIVPATAAGTETFTLWEYLPKADTWQVLTNPGNTDLAPTVELDGRTLKVTSVGACPGPGKGSLSSSGRSRQQLCRRHGKAGCIQPLHGRSVAGLLAYRPCADAGDEPFNPQ